MMVEELDGFLVLTGADGMRARFSPVGAKLVTLDVPVGSGGSVQVVVASAADPSDDGADIWAGAVCGRFSNRIAGGTFTLGGETFQLPLNNGPNSLHGGHGGYGVSRWTPEVTADGLAFHLHSPDGDMGYPGAVDVTAAYGFSDRTLWLELTATTDRTTLCNLTHHAYWNLLGQGSALEHELQVPAARYTPVNDVLIPLGPLAEVAGTAFDFREPRPIAGSYDHNFCLDAGRGVLHLGAALSEAASGRRLEVWTTEPGIQVYTGDHFSSAIRAPFSQPVRNGGIALEPQTYPNAANEPTYPSAVLQPGETYRHRIEWRFSGF